MEKKPLTIIVAIANRNAIGLNNQMLCHLPDDLKRFKRITMGHNIIMGRKTWESLPKKPLPGRNNIVLSRRVLQLEGATVVSSLEQALDLCPLNEESFVIGGGALYRLFLPYVDKLYITRIYHDFEADTFFPDFDEKEWQLVMQEDVFPNETNPYRYSYLTYNRKH
ncbi:MAG TPA: dihydrofolate reductase [Bacteroidales bacterium]|jgi:dihydrofolate reductase|nr:dihydrofolate reductase [Bacteroidales bacterium]MDI9573814.1 dihydrofolate reductase [Bacteroidota bacterium]OQC61321.1 MAG: Dihydrofolate reductase [Bacteroidetes bacterium ADurb.Bin012]MBP9511075.1 dihydrofolate reductase [Bacteroidales bacterium]NMD16639.1 dihydrofolate reductase [Bacteroidales bacterium]